ncbi:hypothetical protein H5410_036511 [Solanum commersonii]|uniref:Uncharacterized protein n=1 Tax=Solanum commersonii TaxID=4109 RepID=A0A9J5Y5U7_SOLCO|nr:hypothetical protein H5410_036511 [Solanum commersonii]
MQNKRRNVNSFKERNGMLDKSKVDAYQLQIIGLANTQLEKEIESKKGESYEDAEIMIHILPKLRNLSFQSRNLSSHTLPSLKNHHSRCKSISGSLERCQHSSDSSLNHPGHIDLEPGSPYIGKMG